MQNIADHLGNCGGVSSDNIQRKTFQKCIYGSTITEASNLVGTNTLVAGQGQMGGYPSDPGRNHRLRFQDLWFHLGSILLCTL